MCQRVETSCARRSRAARGAKQTRSTARRCVTHVQGRKPRGVDRNSYTGTLYPDTRHSSNNLRRNLCNTGRTLTTPSCPEYPQRAIAGDRWDGHRERGPSGWWGRPPSGRPRRDCFVGVLDCAQLRNAARSAADARRSLQGEGPSASKAKGMEEQREELPGRREAPPELRFWIRGQGATDTSCLPAHRRLGQACARARQSRC